MPYNCCLQWWSARLIRERQSLWPFCVRASGPICPTLPPPPARHYGKQFIKKVFLFNLFGQCWPPLPPLQLHITSTNHCLYHGANILIDNEILTSDNEQILNKVALKFLAQDKIYFRSSQSEVMPKNRRKKTLFLGVFLDEISFPGQTVDFRL